MLFYIILNLYDNSYKNVKLSYSVKFTNELAIINSCCSYTFPIRCSRNMTYNNNRINKNIHVNGKKYYNFIKVKYFHLFVLKEAKYYSPCILIYLYFITGLFLEEFMDYIKIYTYYFLLVLIKIKQLIKNYIEK